MRREPLYGDPIESIIVKRSYPRSSEPENRFFELCGEFCEGVFYRVLVRYPGAKSCGEETSKCDG